MPPYKVCWGMIFQQAKIRRRLQSDQEQNASHGQTCSPTRMLMFDSTNQTRHVVKSERGGFKKFCKFLPSEKGIDSENSCCISAKLNFRVGEEGEISTS